MAKGAPTEEKMQKGVDQVSDSCDSYYLTSSIKTIEVVYQPTPCKPYKERTITVKGQRLQVVDEFTYLGSTLSRVVHIDDEVNARIAKASAAFGRLRGSVWDRSGIRLDTKLNVYKAVVLPTLLYAFETWTVYQRYAKRLNHFHTSCLRKLLKIKWQDRIPDKKSSNGQGCRVYVLFWNWHRSCYQDAWGTFAKEDRLWRTRNRQTLPWWSEKAIQRHSQSLPQGFQHSNRVRRGNKMHRTEQSSEASSEEVLVNMKQKESAKPSRNVHSAKPELRHHQ